MSAEFQRKIVSLEELVAAVEEARRAGKTVVQCHGCFDIVHPGHIRYLEFARLQGDLLIVTLTGDSEFSKGDQRPYIPEELRAENVAALMFVDYVHVDPNPTAEQVLAAIKPDVYVKGREYEHSRAPGFLAEKSVVDTYGGRLIFSSGEIVFSSTELIGRMGARPDLESHRLNLFCRRYGITLDSIDGVLERFRDLNVIVVGDIVIDRYVVCDALSIASESPMMSLAQRDERSYVGGAAIVARHAAALGANAFLLSAGADDAQTRSTCALLEKEGVQNHVINFRPALVEKTRILVEDTKLLKLDRGDRLPLDTIAEKRAALILEQQSKIADVVIFCDFGFGVVTAGLLGRVLPSLRQNVRTISADVSGAHTNLAGFRNVDLLCPTEREARTMLNDFSSGLSAVAWQLMDQTQARHLFITLEKRGMVVLQRGSQKRSSPQWSGRLRSEQLPSFADHAVDRLGCGDALLATSTLALAVSDDLMLAAYLGNAAAASELATLGNKPIELDEMRNWLQTRPELARRPAATVVAGV